MANKKTIQKALEVGVQIGLTIHGIEQSASWNQKVLRRINLNKDPYTKENLENVFQLEKYQDIENAYKETQKSIQQEYSQEGSSLKEKLKDAINKYRTSHKEACEYLAYKTHSK